MKIKELKKKIEEQKEQNIKLFTIFQYKMHKEEVQPIVEEWREGSKILKSLIKELNELETKENSNRVTEIESKKIFINGYGEATNKYITTQTYERSQKRNAKLILSFMGNR